ncbi:MAG: Ig-like domain-containing protein [Planctomycetota bacterium]
MGRMWRPALSPWLLPAFAALGACGPGRGELAPLELAGFRQDGRQDVCLNESLVFHFSRRLDRASITAESVRIRDPDHRPAGGRFAVHGNGTTLEFVPDLPRARDLSDGGLRPGTAYEVTILGFPAPDGVRARDGAPLAATFRSTFRTAAAGGPAQIFLNPFTAIPTFLRPESTRIGPFGPIVLLCGEALDPSTVDDTQFQFTRAHPHEEIPLEATLVANEPGGARLELAPVARDHSERRRPRLASDEYHLFVRDGRTAPATLGGRIVPTSWSLSAMITVRPEVSFREDFSDPSRRSPQAVEGADGTAGWAANAEAPGGRVALRFPAAAGDGRAGDVILAPAVLAPEGDALDLAAVDLVVPAGEVADLGRIRGLVLLRAQGTLEIDGTLRREGASAAPPIAADLAAYERERELPLLRARLAALSSPPAGPEARAERERVRREIETRSALSAWLEHAAATGAPWTVLVAGGDLRVRGRIEVDGPLVLVAGGRIRVTERTGRVEAAEVWRTADGGGKIQARGGGEHADLDRRLHLDPPPANVLARPIRHAVLSQAFHPPHGVSRWLTASTVGVAGGGSFAVRFLGEREGGREVLGPVADLDFAEEPVAAVRLLVELEMPAGRGEPWDPPRVEEVRISWKEPAGGGQ